MRINFELLDLRAFLAVVDLGGFHKAADSLNLSQSALSRRIQALEAAVGVPLLERTTRHVSPTTVGRSFEPMARRLIEELEGQLLALTGVGDRQYGQVTLACIPTAAFYFLPRAIERFNAQFASRSIVRAVDRRPLRSRLPPRSSAGPAQEACMDGPGGTPAHRREPQ